MIPTQHLQPGDVVLVEPDTYRGAHRVRRATIVTPGARCRFLTVASVTGEVRVDFTSGHHAYAHPTLDDWITA